MLLAQVPLVKLALVCCGLELTENVDKNESTKSMLDLYMWLSPRAMLF